MCPSGKSLDWRPALKPCRECGAANSAVPRACHQEALLCCCRLRLGVCCLWGVVGESGRDSVWCTFPSWVSGLHRHSPVQKMEMSVTDRKKCPKIQSGEVRTVGDSWERWAWDWIFGASIVGPVERPEAPPGGGQVSNSVSVNKVPETRGGPVCSGKGGNPGTLTLWNKTMGNGG